MPNFMSNILILVGNEGDVSKLKKYVCTDEQLFDFNKIIPMPKSLNIASGSTTDLSIAYYNAVVFNDDSKLSAISHYSWLSNIKSRDLLLDKIAKAVGSKEKALTLGKQYMMNYAEYGCYTWYEWCRKNWNTKWNASNIRLNEKNNMYYFLTAWNEVRPIILKLSIIFPSITFKYYYISEEETYMGFMEIKDGNIYDSYVPDKEKIESLIALI